MKMRQRIRVRVYPVLRRAVEEGAAYGVRRAHKHTEAPSHDALVEAVTQAVLSELCEVLALDDEERA